MKLSNISYFVFLILLFNACSNEVISTAQKTVVVNNVSEVEQLEQQIGIYADLYFNYHLSDGAFTFTYADQSPIINSIVISGTIGDPKDLREDQDYTLQIGDLKYTRMEKSMGTQTYHTFSPKDLNETRSPLKWNEDFSIIADKIGHNVPVSITYKAKQVGQTNMVFPPLLNLRANHIDEWEDGFKLLDFNTAKLMWDADPDNSNGVFFVLNYKGHTTNSVIGGTDENVYRFVKAEDTGEMELNQEMLEGIPKNGLISITAYRGDLQVMEISTGYKVNFSFLARAGLNITFGE